MLLILEIMLTISAWRRGFKAWALLPVGLVFFIGFLIGLNDPEAATNGDFFEYIWLDILAIVALVIMNFSSQNEQEEEFAQVEEIEKENCNENSELAASHSKPGLN